MGKIKTAMKRKKGKKIFFNYVGVSLLQPVAYRAIKTFVNDYMHVGPPEVLEKYQGHVRKLAEEAATLLNCDPDEITYTKNTAEGISIASDALPLKRGDEVLVLANEYPANLLPWLQKRKDRITVTVIKGMDNHKAFMELLAAINKKTKAISISWGQHYDGYLPDLASLSKICKKKGIFLVVDAVQIVGSRVINLKKIHVDFLVCGGQKALGSITGIGFMYVNKNVIPKLKDTRVGIRSVERFDPNGYVIRNTASRFQDGTENLLGIVSLHAAIRRINQIGIKNIERKNLALLKQYKTYLNKQNIPFIDHKNQANIISLRIPNQKEFGTFLRKHNIYIKPIKDVARVSFSHISTMGEFKYFVAKMNEWLEQNPIAH